MADTQRPAADKPLQMDEATTFIELARQHALKDERMKAVFNLSQALELRPDDQELLRLIDDFRCAEDLPAVSGLTQTKSSLPTTRSSARSVTSATPKTQAGIGPIQLKLRRSQHAGITGKAMFVLDARVELSAEDASLVKKYGLGKLVIYDSEARKKHGMAAYGHFDDAANAPIIGATGGSIARSLWSNARGLASIAMLAFTLRVTVHSLMSGVHIECKDLDELLGAEAAILDACRNLKAYLDTALTFDGGEELIEF